MANPATTEKMIEKTGTLSPDQPCDVIVAGLGPAGLAAALAIARLGCDQPLRIIATGHAIQPGRDTRATALMTPSLALLENLGVLKACAARAEPLTGIRLLRAPETLFHATDIGQRQFGASIANADLVAALASAARATANIEIVETSGIQHIEISHRAVTLTLTEGRRIEGRLLVGADGRHSPARAAAGIKAAVWDYPQTAIACTFEHARPHEGVSIEFHRPGGPLTTVPLPGRRSSLVWVEAPAEAQRLLALDAASFAKALRVELHGALGTIETVTPRAGHPLSGLAASSLGQRRTVLVGEAAHVMPPIGAQGLNLGLRDVAELHDVMATDLKTRASGLSGTWDAGDHAILEAYSQARGTDIKVRGQAVDLLNRSLLSAQLPAQIARGLGLHLLSAVPPLRRAVVTQGLAGGSLPSLMQPASSSGSALTSPRGQRAPNRQATR
jgi:2-octaprenyl-6-methoxyphenol hydroxylase